MRPASHVSLLLVGVFLLVGFGWTISQEDRGRSGRSYDWHIRSGTVVDGSGRAARPADVLVRGDTIAHVGAVSPDTIDAA